MNNSSQQLIYGSFEPVVLPEFSDESFTAKIDTGAYSGAIHCSFLEETEKDGHKILQFRPLTSESIQETEFYTHKYVRSSTGHRVNRYLVDTDIIIHGEKYKVTIGLSDRGDMQYEILIGRRFLSEHGIIVDVRINQELDKDSGAQV